MGHPEIGWSVPHDAWKDDYGSVLRRIVWPRATLISPDAPPIRVIQEVPAQRIIESPSRKVILDFGQNLVGKVQIRSIVCPPLQGFYGSGAELHNWSPLITFHGFRYVQVDGWPRAQPSLDDLVAQVMHTDMQRRGWFACSNKHVNDLHRNIVWAVRGNFLSVPTDCPKRDERLGWAGDLQAFADSATFFYNTTGRLDTR